MLFQDINNFINENQSFLITSHIEPDGDAIGSELSMAIQLEKMSKRVFIINPEPVPKRYRFLRRWKDIEIKKPRQNIRIDASIFLDVGNTKRVSWIFDFVKEKGIPILNIDHHVSNSLYGDINYVDKEASSTSECIFDIFKALGIKLNGEICECIATGIITDTGRFSFKNTSEKTFRVCAELSCCGVDFSSLSNYIYNKRSIESIRLLSSVLSTIKVIEGIAFVQLTQRMIKESGAGEEESEGFVNYVLAIGDIKSAVFFREKSNGEIRVSLRSKDETINVNRIASIFNGGGHSQAAGFRSFKSMKELELEILIAFQNIETKRDCSD